MENKIKVLHYDKNKSDYNLLSNKEYEENIKKIDEIRQRIAKKYKENIPNQMNLSKVFDFV